MDHIIAVACSLGCALTWAFASVTFARVMRGNLGVDPHALNLVKSVIALPFFLLGCVVTGVGMPPITDDIGWLVLSALLGLLIADTGYFFALKKLGAAIGVLFIPLVPVCTAVLAALILDEPLTLRTVLGIAITLTGLGVVLVRPGETARAMGTGMTAGPRLPTSTVWAGVVAGALYALSQAGANVAAKHVLDHAVAVHVATLRLGVGAVGLLAASLITGSLPGLRPLFERRLFGGVVAAALIGTLGGVWLGSIGAKGLPVGVATTLSATTPLWAIALTRLSGESIKPRALVGAVVAVVGVVVLASASPQ